MTLGEYLFGRRIVLHSPLPADVVTRRMNIASAFVLLPSAKRLTGWAMGGRACLQWSNSSFPNGFKAAFYARIIESSSGTEIRARFVALLGFRIIFAFWVFLLIFGTLIPITIMLSDHPKTGNEPLGVVLMPLLAVASIAYPYVTNRFFNPQPEAELKRILDFLSIHVQAAAQPDARLRGEDEIGPRTATPAAVSSSPASAP